jgi:hypothetical protein
VNARVLTNSATRVYGRAACDEADAPAYRSLGKLRDTLPLLVPGEVLIQHAPFPHAVKVRFPRPAYRMVDSE